MLTQISEKVFRSRYVLGKQITYQGVRTFEARDTADRVVMVHFVGSVESAETAEWLAALERLPPNRRRGLVGAFQVGGEAVLVTEFQPHVRSFEDWFVSIAGEPTLSDVGSPPGIDGMPYDGPTLLTGALDAGADQGMGSQPPEPTAGQPAAEAKEGAGDFTSMFGPVKPAEEKPPEEPPPDEVVSGFGDAAAGKPPPMSQPESEPPARQPGEFTRLFGALSEPKATGAEKPAGSVPPAQDEPPQAPEPPAQVPGQVTPTAAGAGPDEARRETPPQEGGFTEIFGTSEGGGGHADRSQTLAEQPGAPEPPRTTPSGGQPEEPHRAGPRIVWRDRAAEPPAEPREPKVKIRWGGDQTPRAGDGRVQEPPTEPEQPSGPPKEYQPPSKEPAPPPQVSKPGQFTEIFGQALTPGSEPSAEGPGSPGADQDDFRFPDVDLPPHETGPRKSVSEQIAPLSGRGSADYLQALNADSAIEPAPPAPVPEAPAPEPGVGPPDLPPPVVSPTPAPGPSDYTQIVSGQSVQPGGAPVAGMPGATPPQPAAPPVAPPPAAAPAASAPTQSGAGEPEVPKTPTWLWVALGAIGIVAVLLIVIVVLI